MPGPCCKEVQTCFLNVDSDHAGDHLNRRLWPGFLVFIKSATLIWFWKQQLTVETSVFVAIKWNGNRKETQVQVVHGGYYPPLMTQPSSMWTDSMSVIHNMYRPESTLEKKSNYDCSDNYGEPVAMNKCVTEHAPTKQNSVDLCTIS